MPESLQERCSVSWGDSMTENMNKILISPSSFGKCGNQPLELIKKNNYEAILNPFGRKMTPDEVIKLGEDCIGIIAGVESLNAMVLESLPHLQCISRCGSGIDNIDLEKAKELKIVVKNTPYGPTRAVAELTVGLIFDLLRQISYRDRAIRNGKWNKEMGFLLRGKTVGVLGLGRIGRTVVELLLKLDANVIGSDIYPDEQWLKKTNIPLLSSQELIKECDIICIHVSYKSKSKYLLGKNEIASMKKGAYIVNLSRGGVVDETALFNALEIGHLRGAAIDVFQQEPYNGPLIGLENVVLTPHIGSYALESRLQMELQSVENLMKVLKGKLIAFS